MEGGGGGAGLLVVAYEHWEKGPDIWVRDTGFGFQSCSIYLLLNSLNYMCISLHP